jgi:hypothetical protein
VRSAARFAADAIGMTSAEPAHWTQASSPTARSKPLLHVTTAISDCNANGNREASPDDAGSATGGLRQDLRLQYVTYSVLESGGPLEVDEPWCRRSRPHVADRPKPSRIVSAAAHLGMVEAPEGRPVNVVDMADADRSVVSANGRESHG